MIAGIPEWFVFAVEAISLGALCGMLFGYLSDIECVLLVGMAAVMVVIKAAIDAPEAMIAGLMLAGVLLIALGRRAILSAAMAANGVFFFLILPEHYENLMWFN